jgi:hypothetical protein
MAMYYTARRTEPLTPDERGRAGELIEAHQPDRYLEQGGEAFTIFPVVEDGEVLAGSVGLPETDVETMWEATLHWADLLTELRRALPADLDWTVSLDDVEMLWNAQDGWDFPEDEDD